MQKNSCIQKVMPAKSHVCNNVMHAKNNGNNIFAPLIGASVIHFAELFNLKMTIWDQISKNLPEKKMLQAGHSRSFVLN